MSTELQVLAAIRLFFCSTVLKQLQHLLSLLTSAEYKQAHSHLCAWILLCYMALTVEEPQSLIPSLGGSLGFAGRHSQWCVTVRN